MKKVYSARDEVDAEMAKMFLTNAGVESIVQGGGLRNIIGEIPVSEGSSPSVWVRDEDVDQAMEVLREFKNPPPAQGGPWKCPKCGEVVEPQFTQCWNCGTAKPEGPNEK
jgi:hypothetical protein